VPRRSPLAVLTPLAALLIAATTLLATPAAAGGPTSVLLVLPGSGRTASLSYDDPEYEALSRLIGPGRELSATATGVPDADGSSGSAVTVTWLLHDVLVWRVDRVYPQAAGGPWIATELMDESSRLLTSGRWHTAADGPQLTALLSRLGVLPGAPRSGAATSAPAAPAAPATAPPRAATASPPRTSQQASAGVAAAWALGGLAAGVAGTLGSLRIRSRPRRSDDGRPVRTPEPAAADPDAEVLASPRR